MPDHSGSKPSKTVSRRKAAIFAVVMSGLTAGVTISLPAYGFSGAAIVIAIHALEKAIGSWFSGQTSDFLKGNTKNVDRQVAATAGAADGIRETIVDSRNKQIEMEMQAAPTSCASAAIGQAAAVLRQQEQEGVRATLKRQTRYSLETLSPVKSVEADIKRWGNDPDKVADTSNLMQSVYDDQDEKQAQETIKLITEPVPARKLPPSKTNTVEGREYLHTQAEYAAKINVARLALNQIAQDRTPSKFAQQYIDRTAGTDAYFRNWTGKPVSMIGLMQYEAGRRFENPGWQRTLNDQSQAAVIREIANELAFQNWMLVRQYQQQQRVELMLATQLSEQLKKSKSNLHVPTNLTGYNDSATSGGQQ